LTHLLGGLAEKIPDSPDAKNADVACDFYHRYKVECLFLSLSLSLSLSIYIYNFLFFIFYFDNQNIQQEDVQLLKKIGVDSFKFSISWSRVLPSKIMA
jgi:beta-glucosidase/6-phospho-beta-glucosidase/beta-galactosidase